MQETTFALELKSHPKNISVIEPYINQVVEAYDVDHEMYGNILISLTEAVNNAIMHGNDGDEEKMVRVELKKNTKNLVFSISDDGAGFNYDDLPDPTAPENILKLGGRGIFLMKQLADLVVFSSEGNTVEIQFNL
ncbi:MAG: ATP-binding protein [Saprospiraceae bacterium]